MLSEIDNFRQRNNGRYPDEIYLQVDGGVSKRVSKEILYSRNPNDHTHEDKDAVFGVIWTWVRLLFYIS